MPAITNDQFSLLAALVAGLLSLLVASGTGFLLGLWLAPWWQRRQFRRALHDLSIWQNKLLVELEQVESKCEWASRQALRQFPIDRLSRLERVRSRLVASLETLATIPAERARNAIPFHVEWITGTADRLSGLPNRASFDQNLKLLLGAGQAANTVSGVVFVKMDRYESGIKRYGQAAVDQLWQRLVTLVIRASRDADLICQIERDTLAVLLPNLAAGVAWERAESIRETIRTHHFLLEETSQEVVVTASSGFTTCLPEDDPEDVISRVQKALLRAESQGRNRLEAE